MGYTKCRQFRCRKDRDYIIHYNKKNLLIKLAKDNKLSIEDKEIKFNINIIKQLGIILNLELKFKIHVD